LKQEEEVSFKRVKREEAEAVSLKRVKREEAEDSSQDTPPLDTVGNRAEFLLAQKVLNTLKPLIA